MLGPALVWAGARAHFDRPRPALPIVLGLAGVGVALLAFPGAGPMQIVVGLAAAAWSIATVVAFLEAPEARRRSGVRIAAALFALHGAFQIARAFFPLPHEAGPVLGMEAWPRVLVAAGSIFFVVAWGFAVLGLTSQRLLDRLRVAARTDGLTGLLNRGAFLDDAGRVLELCRRRGRSFALLLADFDHFKRLNDERGHAAGDDALRSFGARAAALAPEGTILGRYGGEEFAVALPGADEAAAVRWADRLREAIGAAGPCTLSVGVAAGQGGGLDLERLVAAADAALYRAKADGRDRVRAASAIPPAADRRPDRPAPARSA